LVGARIERGDAGSAASLFPLAPRNAWASVRPEANRDDVTSSRLYPG
jgi:hypothetical protein